MPVCSSTVAHPWFIRTRFPMIPNRFPNAVPSSRTSPTEFFRNSCICAELIASAARAASWSRTCPVCMITVLSSPPRLVITDRASPKIWYTCGRTASCIFSRFPVIGPIDCPNASETVCRSVRCRCTSWIASDAASAHAPTATAAGPHTEMNSITASAARCQMLICVMNFGASPSSSPPNRGIWMLAARTAAPQNPHPRTPALIAGAGGGRGTPGGAGSRRVDHRGTGGVFLRAGLGVQSSRPAIAGRR